MPKDHLSNTQLAMMWRCGEQYRRRYVEKEIIPPRMALLIGGGLHGGIEENLLQKIESHRDLPTSQIIDAAVSQFEMRAHLGYTLSAEEESIGARKVLGDATDTVATLAMVHATEQAPEYQPTEVEKETTIELPNCSRDLKAVTDVRDTQGRVTDFKTAARKERQQTVDTSIQLSIYAAAYQVDHGRPPSEVRLDVLTKTKHPERQLLRSQRDVSDMETLANRINVTLRAIESGIFTPADPSDWRCSDKWCGYFRTCPYAVKRGTE